MSRNHDPFRCPHCQSTRTRAMRMVTMAGTRIGRADASRATIGARGWWSLSGSESRWTSQTALAKRYAPPSPVSGDALIAMMLVGAGINGMTGALLALVVGLTLAIWLIPNPPDGFVCMRCGCEFRPRVNPNGFVSRSC